MGVLEKQKTAVKWKEKYLDLLDEQEEKEISFKNKTDLLCHIIVRLSIVAQGVNKHLDPHLNRFRKLLNKGLNEQKLKAELENFSNTLLQLEESSFEDSRAEATLLFDFLMEYVLSPTEQNSLGTLHEAYNKGQITSSQELFAAILEIIRPIQETVLSPVGDEPLSDIQIDADFVSKQLLHLFDDFEIPVEFESQVQTIRTSLKSEYLAEKIKSVLQAAVELSIKIKQCIQLGQRDVESFLTHLTNQLTELSQQAADTNFRARESSLKQNEFGQSVTEQMQELQQNSDIATKLEPLKQLINARLDSISRQFQEHRRIENINRLENEKKLGELTYKINQMESEAGELKSKFMLAHDKALRDSLTGLPNRMAYEERLDTEFARWKRYQSPLSMVIWDIDHFKHINDNFGHKAGDKALIIIAKLLAGHCRETDFVCRYGGEEFVMLLPNTNKTSALNLADKLRRFIEETGFNSKGTSISITVSCGISQVVEGDNKEKVFERADQGLYKAKENGRNQCAIS